MADKQFSYGKPQTNPFAVGAQPQSATGSRGAPQTSPFDSYTTGMTTGMPTNPPNFSGGYDLGKRMSQPLPQSQGGPTNPDNNLMVKGNSENFYGDTSGEYKAPSYTEQLVGQGMGGQLNDYYEFANNKLNDQFAAMGGGPSGALLRATQGLRANQAHDMMDYTKSADEIHYGRLGAGQHAAGEADAGQRGRLGLAFGSALGLGSSEAGLTGGFYGNAAASSNPFTTEGINAGVQKSTIDPAKSALNDVLSAAGAGAKMYYGMPQTPPMGGGYSPTYPPYGGPKSEYV